METLTQKTEDAIKENEGKIVEVITHLQSHLSNPRKMLCIGHICQDCSYLFMNSVRERLDGKKVINGMLVRTDCVGYDHREGVFIAYLGYNCHEQYPFREIRGLVEEDYSKAMRMWEGRAR